MASKYIIIGGSAGSFKPVMNILSALPSDYPYPIFVCLHRLRHIRTGFEEALSLRSKLKILEPNDGETITNGYVYLAPANYHMYFEPNYAISLSTEPPVNHSRPSIDVAFMSAAHTFKSKLIGIILSGANTDGAIGMETIKETGGTTIVQTPEQSQVNVMVNAAIEKTNVDYVFSVEEIISYLLNISLNLSK